MDDPILLIFPLILVAVVGVVAGVVVVWLRRAPDPTFGRCPAIDGRGQRCAKKAFHTDEHSTSRLLRGWLPPNTPPLRPALGDKFFATFSAPSREEATKLADKHAASIAGLGWRPHDRWSETQGDAFEGLLSLAGGSRIGHVELVVTYEYRPRGT